MYIIELFVKWLNKRQKKEIKPVKPTFIELDEAEFAIVDEQFSSTQTLRVPFKQDGDVRTYNVFIIITNGWKLVVEGYEGGELIELISVGSSSTTEGVPCLLTIITAYVKETDQGLALVIKTDLK